MEFVGKHDLVSISVGAEAIDADSVGDPDWDSDVISLTFDSAPVVDFKMLVKGSSAESSAATSKTSRFGFSNVPMWWVSQEQLVANVFKEFVSS